ncbi:MAG TPA: hypothetical protein PKA64_19820 [Myxococcota bacterium]|nr:hypothetical protein [Myxococcota bacterium]
MVYVLLLAACQEYGLKNLTPDVPEPEDSDPPVVETEVPRDTAPPEQPAPSCEGVTLSLVDVVASAPFSDEADPVDGAGVSFYAVGFDASGWSGVALPDVGSIPVGFDRAYRGTLRVVGEPPAAKLELQSDDGIAVWIDGVRIGRWGGAWQEEGCVNDDASCLVFQQVAPVDISPRVRSGDTPIAFRVSNPVANSYVDLRVHCVTP